MSDDVLAIINQTTISFALTSNVPYNSRTGSGSWRSSIYGVYKCTKNSPYLRCIFTGAIHLKND